MGFVVVIPARHASTRLPGKPLRLIAGRPMIEHVWRQATASAADEVVIATDDERIAAAAAAFGARVCLTDSAHPSGTDRVDEVARKLGLDDGRVLVNLQGDEPLMPPALIDQVAADLEAHPEAAISTLCEPVESAKALFDPNVVKVVIDEAGFALYFSRAPVPWSRRDFAGDRRPLPAAPVYFRHVGIYAYRAGYLRRFVAWGVCALEHIESLEQLRALWHGGRIHCARAVEKAGIGVDDEGDLAAVERILAARGAGG